MPKSNKLKPCPWCGGDNVQVGCMGMKAQRFAAWWFVECCNCMARGPQKIYADTETNRQHVRLWNTRRKPKVVKRNGK